MAGTSGATVSTSGVSALLGIGRDIASVTGQACAFRPEISLLLELYEAQSQDQCIKASSLGLASGIAQSTAIRCLRYLEEQGWLALIPDEIDQNVSYPHLTQSILIELDAIFNGRDDWAARNRPRAQGS